MRKMAPRLFVTLALIAGMLGILPTLAQAEDENIYYVAPEGDDAGPGTWSQPWATVGRAAEVLQPGDTVWIRAGRYAEAVYTARSGQANAPITFRAFPGEEVILEGSALEEQAGFNVGVGHAHIIMDGLHIRNFARFGAVLWGNNHHIEIRNVDLAGADVGLQLTEVTVPGATVEDSLLSGVYAHGNRVAGVSCSPGPCRRIRIVGSVASHNGPFVGVRSVGFSFESGEDITFERSQAIDNAGSGFDMKANGAHIARTLAAGNALSGIELWGQVSSLENSIARDNGGAGIVLQSSGPYTITNSIIAHNGLRNGSYSLVAGPESSVVSGLKLYNTIFAFNGGAVFFGESVMLQEDHNIYYSQETSEIQAAFTARYNYSRSDLYSGIWFMDTGNGRHSASVDPAFQNGEGRDYHSRLGGPAIDAGNNAWAPAVDYDGVSRPQGDVADIGAFEYVEWRLKAYIPLILRR